MKNYIFPLLLLTGFVSYTNAQTVTIGSQVWMTKNLDVATFRNGDPIPQAKTDEEWTLAGENKQPAWCYFNNDPKNGEAYGKLYNWYAVNDRRGLAPQGWHIPSDAEWTQLTDFLGGVLIAGEKMKSTIGWKDNGNGTNASGFNGLPGSFRWFGTFYDVGLGYWWSSTEESTYVAWYRVLGYSSGSVGRYFVAKWSGSSVRCLRD